MISLVPIGAEKKTLTAENAKRNENAESEATKLTPSACFVGRLSLGSTFLFGQGRDSWELGRRRDGNGGAHSGGIGLIGEGRIGRPG